jgi:hypothetical protein
MKLLVTLVIVTFMFATAQNLHYLNLDDLDANPQLIKVSPNMSATIEFQENVTGGLPLREDWFTYNIDKNIIYVDAKVEVGEASMTVRVNGKTAMFVIQADMSLVRPNNYVVRSAYQAEPKVVTTLKIPSMTTTPDPSAAPAVSPIPAPTAEPVAPNVPATANEVAPVIPVNPDEMVGVPSYGDEEWQAVQGEGKPYTFYARLDEVEGLPQITYKLENRGDLDISNDITRLTIRADGERLRYESSRQDNDGFINRLVKGESETGTVQLEQAVRGPIEVTWTILQYTTNEEFVIKVVLP